MTSLPPLRVNLKLVDLVCRDEGDGWGSAEPYLWTAFFKIDGTTVSINPDLTMSGTAQIAFGPGSHGNLGDSDVDGGDVVPIPAAIGEWTAPLRAIPLPAPLDSLLPAVSGIVGVICVLMEEDWVSDEGAEAGHQAFNSAIESAFNTLINSNTLIDLLDPNAAIGGLGNLMNSVKDGIVNAIRNKQNVLENLVSWLNPDDFVGLYVETFTQAELIKWGSESFYQDWKNEGDWRIRGLITSAVIPTFDRFTEVVPQPLRKRFRLELESVWKGDSGAKGLREWSAAIEPLWPEVAHHLRHNKKARSQAERAIASLAAAVIAKGSVPEEVWETAEAVLKDVKAKNNRHGRIRGGRLLELLPSLREKELNEVAATLREALPKEHRRDRKGSRRAKS